MPRRPRRPFEVVKTKLPPKPRRSIPGGRWRSGPHRRKPEPTIRGGSSAELDQPLADWDRAENPDTLE